MKQDYIAHIHPIANGHEYISLDYLEKLDMPIIVTPHIEERNPKYKFENLYNKTLDNLDKLSKENKNIIKGAEFTLQSILDLPEDFVNSFNIKLVSLHSKYKLNGYIMKNNDIDLIKTVEERNKEPYIYVPKYTAKELLCMAETIFTKYKVHILGHLDRGLDEVLITKSESYTLYTGLIELAKKYNISVEICVDMLDPNSFTKHLNYCLSNNVKVIVGLNAHHYNHIKYRYKKQLEILRMIDPIYQVSLEELMED